MVTLLFVSRIGEAYTADGPVFVINPDTLNITGTSKVEFGHVQHVQQYANYMAPEMEELEFVCSASSVEQVTQQLLSYLSGCK